MAKRTTKNRRFVLKNGERQRTNGSFEFRYKDEMGKRKSIYAPTLRQLREKERQLEQNPQESYRLHPRGDTVLESLKEWMSLRPVKQTTEHKYEQTLRRLEKYSISKKSITKVTEMDIRRWIKEMKHTYMPGTIEQTVGLVSAAMDLAVRENKIRFNPCDFPYSSLIGKEKLEKNPLSDEEFNRIIDIMESSEAAEVNYSFRFYVPYVKFLRETGLRIGEFCGLRLSDIDFTKHSITIRQQISKDKRFNRPKKSVGPSSSYRESQNYLVLPPKTESSMAEIPMTQAAEEAIWQIIDQNKEYVRELDGMSGFFVLSWQPPHYILTEHAFRCVLHTVADWYEKIYGEEIYITPHILRHTAATRMLRHGVPVQTVQAIMRHANVNTTIKSYVHLTTEDHLAALRQAGIGCVPDLGSANREKMEEISDEK